MDDEIDKSEWVEHKIYITFKCDPNEMCPDGLYSTIQHIIESDGFGEIIDYETK